MSLSLPILDSRHDAHPPRAAKRLRSRLVKWRVISLTIVHLLIFAHIIHWQVAGETLAPVVLSKSMETLELGRINPAFVLFAALILITVLFGRFFCGWACHMGALQDLSYWLMRKLGIRPAPFRTRLLPYLPLAFALYMFIWPTFKRLSLEPIFATWWPAGLRSIGQSPPFPGWSTEWTTDQMWSGLPGVWVAIPFLFICGVAVVYFLGARGFCQYGCPYGGLFKPVERFAPGRVIVNSNKCDSCGQCTAVCTSNINVLQELREYGGVVSAHCTRNLDCLSVCPQNALSFKVTRPTAKNQESPFLGLGMRTHSSDPTLREELALLLIFALIFFITRGLYDLIPMLLAVGLGVCGMVIGWKLMRLIRDRDVRMHRFQLKRAGSIKPVGIAFTSLVLVGSAALAQGALVKYYSWQAGTIDDRVTVSRELVFTQPHAVPDEMREFAADALEHYRLASGWRSGGLGFADTPANDIRSAWLLAVIGSYSEADAMLARALDRIGPDEVLIAERARLMLLDGRPSDAAAYLNAMLGQHSTMRDGAHNRSRRR